MDLEQSRTPKLQAQQPQAVQNFTPFTANGTFDIYMYFVSSTGNTSPNSLVLAGVVMN
jgi:hypothetical protein